MNLLIKKLLLMTVLYSANPRLNLKIVDTFDGSKEYLKNCRKVGENYYLSTDCIIVDGEYVYKDNPNLLKDFETGNLFLKENKGRRVYGVVEIDDAMNPIYGYFSSVQYKNVKFIDSNRNTTMAISEDIFKNKKNYIENLSEGIWYYHAEVSSDVKKNHAKIRNVHDWTAKKYNIEDNAREFELKKKMYNDYNHPVEDFHKRFGRFLNYSWGIEFEVAAGFIPDHLQYRHGVVVCRDGSIQGGEYVTVPMEGPKGLSALHELCEASKKRVLLDINCSMHLHLGKFPIQDRKALSALYILCLRIQDDIFDMLPPYKRYWEGFKRKNYCRHLENMGIQILKNPSESQMAANINVIFEKIFSFISDFRRNLSQYREGDQHPSGAKWDIENRKTWINFVNTMYSNRKTLEFRCHQATFNPVKTVNWLFICSAILDFARANSNDLLTIERRITLEEVLSTFAFQNPGDHDAEFLSNYLNQYCRSRKEEFTRSFKDKDFPCSWDLQKDKDYDFRFEGRNLLM